MLIIDFEKETHNNFNIEKQIKYEQNKHKEYELELYKEVDNYRYRKVGGHYLPDLVTPENIKNFKLVKYGKLRLIVIL